VYIKKLCFENQGDIVIYMYKTKQILGGDKSKIGIGREILGQ